MNIRKNHSGQVAIFVAIIFQIIFVLFAMVINVGLIVHHKINLQQSTDLSAYYGATKQADLLNVVSHMNYQMRQAWKLMTWRYRVLGTFGYKSNDPIGLPIEKAAANALVFNDVRAKQKCSPPTGSTDQFSISDFSPFCVGHVGFGDWSADASTFENACNGSCSQINDGVARIPAIPALVNAGSVPGNNTAAAVASLISIANNTGRSLCRRSTVANLAQISNILSGYFLEIEDRRKAIELVMAGLLVSADKMIDLDGGLVKDGALATLKNNLTEPNSSSLKPPKFFNSLSDDNSSNGGCANRTQVFNELSFQIVQLIMNVCVASAAPSATDDMRTNTYDSIFEGTTIALNNKIAQVAISEGVDISQIQNLLQNRFKIGYEKNPWCQSYFGVRAETEPSIPFLPLVKIKLQATALAKPFGGSIGPWFYTNWNSNEVKSSGAKQTDQTLPPLLINAGAMTNLRDRIRLLPNFSNYIGDVDGLRDPMYQAIYHDFLLSRSLDGNSPAASRNRAAGGPSPGFFSKPLNGYPYFANLRNTFINIADPKYDPIAMDQANIANSYIRDLEISAIAPNQFDLTYYSIEPDYYFNYYKDRLSKPDIINKFKALTSNSDTIIVRPDYGYNKSLAQQGQIPEEYSVRHQLAVVEQIFRKDASSSGKNQMRSAGLNGSSEIADKYFTFIPRFQGSLLTGWTYKDLVSQDGFTDFPIYPNSKFMPFGRCEDAYSNSPHYGSLAEENKPGGTAKLPAASGNCITGGRTGYSVKIVSPAQINGIQGDIGGPGIGGGPINNPIPPDFFVF